MRYYCILEPLKLANFPGLLLVSWTWFLKRKEGNLFNVRPRRHWYLLKTHFNILWLYLSGFCSIFGCDIFSLVCLVRCIVFMHACLFQICIMMSIMRAARKYSLLADTSLILDGELWRRSPSSLAIHRPGVAEACAWPPRLAPRRCAKTHIYDGVYWHILGLPKGKPRGSLLSSSPLQYNMSCDLQHRWPLRISYGWGNVIHRHDHCEVVNILC